jgi:hypothetical protein
MTGLRSSSTGDGIAPPIGHRFVGEAPNLAARLQAIAEPNTIVIAEATHALAGDLFECTSLGARTLKGFETPLAVWRVDAPRPIESRFEAMRMRSLTPFIGRDEEIAILERRWQRACRSEGQVVLLSGEAGIGKSRIVSAFRERVGAQSHTWLRYQCSPYYTNSALYPIVEQLALAARIEVGDDPARKLAKLEALLALSRRPTATAVPLIAPLLSIPLGDQYPPVTVSPQLQKQLTLAALVDQLAGLAEQRPVLFHFEDAHWIDPTSRELLDLLIARTANLVALVINQFPLAILAAMDRRTACDAGEPQPLGGSHLRRSDAADRRRGAAATKCGRRDCHARRRGPAFRRRDHQSRLGSCHGRSRPRGCALPPRHPL